MHATINFLFYASLPFAIAGFLAFVLFTYWRQRTVFAVATVSSLLAFGCLTLLIPLLLIEHGGQALFLNATREIFYAWVIMIIYFVAEFRYRIRLLGSIVMPVALLFLLLSVFEKNSTVQTIDLRGLPTFVHMVLTFAGFALFFLAFAAASLYLFKMRTLKSRQVNALDSDLPALTTLKRIMVETFRLSFPVFTLGMILGCLYAAHELTAGWYSHPFFILACIIWIFFAAAFYLHHSGRFGSVALAKTILILFALIVTLSVFGSHKTMWEGLQRKSAPPAEEIAP